MIKTFRVDLHRTKALGSLVFGLLSTCVCLPLVLASCQDGAGIGAAETDATGALSGEYQTLVVDHEDGTSEREHYLILSDPAQTRLRLAFDGMAAPAGSDSIRAWGVRQGATLHVTAYETLDDAGPAAGPGVASSATAALTGVTPRPRKAVFVIVDVGGGTKLTNASAASAVFSPGKNFSDVYNQLSYGILQMSGDVVGPLSFPTTTCDYNGAARALKPMITGTYNHYMWYFATNPGCAWSGLGAEGNVSRAQTDSWYNASTGCTVLVQEVGHNLGWMHSSTLRCPGSASFADDPLTCTSSEYGNRYTPMGSGCGHFTAYDKWYGGLIGGCNGAKVTSSGTFNLMPLENACNGLQGIQIPMLNTTRTADPQQGNPQPLKNYFLEYRGPWGLDATAVKTPQVMVYAVDDVHAATRTSNWTWLLDMVPSTMTTFEGLAVGQSFTDPAGGITIQVMSADTSKAVVQIDITGGAGAAPICIDGTELSGAGPADCGTGAAASSPTGAGGAPGVPGAGGAGASAAPGPILGIGGATGSGGSPGTATGGGARATGGSRGGGSGGSSGASGGSAGTITGTGGAAVGTGPSAGGSGSGAVTSAPGSAAAGGSGTPTATGPGEAAGSVTGGCACDTAAGSSAGGSTPPIGLVTFALVAFAWMARARRPRARREPGRIADPIARGPGLRA